VLSWTNKSARRGSEGEHHADAVWGIMDVWLMGDNWDCRERTSFWRGGMINVEGAKQSLGEN